MDASLIWTIIGAFAGIIGAYYTYISVRNSKYKSKVEQANFTKFIDEEDFVNAQVNIIGHAKYSVLLCLHTANESSINWKAEKINNALAKAKMNGIHVCVLTSSGSKQLSGAFELSVKNKIELRMSSELRYSDLRFLLVDSKVSILGLSETDYNNPEYSPSKSWGQVNSESLAGLLNQKFYQIWFSDTSKSFISYFDYFIEKNGKTISPSVLAKEMNIPVDFIVKRLTSQRPLFKPNEVFVFHGKSGSGKSTLISRLAKDYSLKELDIINLVLPYVEKYGNENVANEMVKSLYQDLLKNVAEFDFDIIETGTELPNYLLPELFKILKKKNRVVKLVYCKTDLKMATKRNRKRYRQVPAAVLKEQDLLETSGAFREICNQNNIEIITLDTNQEFNTTYSKLKKDLKLA